MLVSHPVVRDEEIRLAVQSIVASETFNRSQQLCRLLRYLCDAAIAGDADRLSEHAIGTDALGRSADFDPAEDAAVRVEMHRLRRRLRDYYAGEGAESSVRIEIPVGSYAPVLRRLEEEPAPAPERDVEPAVEPVVVAEPPKRPRWTPKRPVLWGGLALAIAAASLAWVPSERSGKGLTIPLGEPFKAAAAVLPPAPGMAVRIGCGRTHQWTDRFGQIWAPDAYFEGGEVMAIPPRSYIAGAFDSHLFRSARTGSFHYRIPMPSRNYEMRLYFIEPVFGPENDQGGEGNRLFNISINGKKVLDRFDILTDADGPWTADVRVFKDIAPESDGYVRLDFETIVTGALLNAIEFVPALPNVLNPVRLLPQDNFYTDSAGNLWTPDNYSRGGRVAVHPGPVKNTLDPEIFRHERYGRFRYAVPVDRGSYSVYLYMSEEYWGPENPGKGGLGTRVFSVFCNGFPLLHSLDLYRDSGMNSAVVRSFHHLAPNAQGKLLLSFEPEHDYASLYALEVLDEAGPFTPSYLRTVTGASVK